MIEILPNWHPIFVHFTIALLSMSVVFYLLQAFFPEDHPWQKSTLLLAKANLWIGTGFALITAVAGWFAYNSVTHDTPSHAAMTDHRNWALVTLAVFVVLTIWSILFRKQNKAPVLFVIMMLISGGLLASTGWKGAESVYRYGLGVMSMPQSSGEGHAHEHADGEGHATTQSNQDQPPSPTVKVGQEHADGEGHATTQSNQDQPPSPTVEVDVPSNTTQDQPSGSHNKTPHSH